MEKKVKSITCFTSQFNDEDSRYKSSFQEFNEEGKPIEDISYFKDQEIDQQSKYSYNESGQLIEETLYYGEDDLTDKVYHDHNDEGKLVESKKVFQDGSFSTTSFNRSTDKVETITMDDEEELEEKVVAHINDKQQVILREVYDYTGKMIEKYENQFNDEGEIIGQTQHQLRDKLVLHTELEYENGNMIKQITRNRRQEVTHQLMMKYDEKDRVILQKIGNEYLVKTSYDDATRKQTEERENASGIIESSKSIWTNEEDKIIREEEDGLIKEYTYEYY